jgi:Viral BACON domain
MRPVTAALWAFFLAVALAACGGGGGNEGGGATLTFSPATVAANVTSGSSATVTVRATASDTSLFSRALYVYVVDSEQVLTPSIELAPIDSTTISATLHTSPALAEGRHQGTFQIQLCNDTSCTSQVRGSPIPLPYDLTITPAPLHATAGSSTAASVHRGGSITNQIAVSVTGPALAWTATTSASWLQIVGGAGTGPGSFNVSYLTQTLVEGSYSTTVTVRSSDGQTSVLPFTLDVLPTQFVLNSGVPSFNAVNGAPIAAQTLDFALDNGVPSAWTAASSAAWMLVSPLAGTTPGVVTLQPDPTRGPLASGAYTSDLVLSSTGFQNKTITTELTLSKPTLSAPALAVTLGGTKGRDLTTAQSLSVSLNTGTNSWPYALSGFPAWLSSSTPTGSVNQSGTTLSVAPNLGNVTPGSTSATVSMTATVNGDSVVLPLTVNLNADQRRLLASEWGVAFASTPTGTALSRTLTISDNFSGTLAWTASSDAAWLAVTSSGNTSGSSSIVLSADPSALPANAMSYANVTVSTATNGVEAALIRVALWKSASGLAGISSLPLDYSSIVADKIRPYVYANNGGTTVDVFNAYTAQKIGTITGVGAALGQMSVAPDGSRLYALDTASRSMAAVDLSTLVRTATWPLDNAVNGSTSVLAIRPNGVDIVLVGDGTAYAGGRSLGRSLVPGALAATADGRNVYNLGVRFSIDYSAMSGGVLFPSLQSFLDFNSGGNEKDVAVSKDGARVYAASGGGVNVPGRYRCASIDSAGTFVGALPGGDAYPNNVEVTIDGRPICGISGGGTSPDFWVHSPAGAVLQGYKVAGTGQLKDRQMVVTPDGFIVVALTTAPLIGFVPIGP